MQAVFDNHDILLGVLRCRSRWERWSTLARTSRGWYLAVSNDPDTWACIAVVPRRLPAEPDGFRPEAGVLSPATCARGNLLACPRSDAIRPSKLVYIGGSSTPKSWSLWPTSRSSSRAPWPSPPRFSPTRWVRPMAWPVADGRWWRPGVVSDATRALRCLSWRIRTLPAS
eukprot:5103443-Prymnesium_polylepis.1